MQLLIRLTAYHKVVLHAAKMPINIKAEPSSPERGLPPPVAAAQSSAESEDGVEVLFEPETPQAPARRNTGSTSSKRKNQASGAKKYAAEKEWNFTYMPASTEQRKRNGRVEGRNLITWNRKSRSHALSSLNSNGF